MARRILDLKTNFLAGEITGEAFVRSDIQGYANGCETLSNWLIRPVGPVRSRPGTLYKQDIGEDAPIAPFVFDDDQIYFLAFMNTQVKIYDEDGTLVTTLASTPWTTAQLDKISWTHSGDTMFVYHEDVPTQIITRTGASTFTFAAISFETNDGDTIRYQPYYKFAAAAVTLTPSATTGSINLTASAAVFTADYVDTIVRYKGNEVLITAFTSTTVLVGTVRVTLAATTAAQDWDEQEYSAVRGYAAAGVLHAGRHWMAGSKGRPAGVNASNVGAFYKFDLGSSAKDDALQEDIDSDSVSNIRRIVSGDHLIFLTDLAAFFVPSDEENPITPETFSFKRIAGSSGTLRIRPVAYDNALMYAQKGGRAIGELGQISARRYAWKEVTTLWDHLINTPVDFDVLNVSDETNAKYAFAVMTDGTMAVCLSNRDENVLGWLPWTTDGSYLRVCVANEHVMFLVKRTIGEVDKYYLEKMDFDTTVDCAIASTSGTATATWTGLSHLEGETVHGVNDTSYHGSAVVASGTAVFDSGDTAITMGLDFTPTIKTLRVERAVAEGTIMGEMKRVIETLVASYDSVLYSVGGRELVMRNVTDDLSLAPSRETGFHRFILLGWDRDGQVTITRGVPIRTTIAGLQIKVAF
jgi:hypothetical protein